MTFEESWLTSPASPRLFVRRARAATPRAAVAVVHGFGEHGGRYETVVERFAVEGFDVWLMDHRGHGRSEGRRGHVDDWGQYRNDVGAFVDRVHTEAGGRPMFLLGHSMGALVAVDYVCHRPHHLAGLIASAIGLRPGKLASGLQILLARVLSRVAPRMPLNMGGLDGARISRDPAVVDAYRRDPLVHAEATLSWGREALAALDRVRALAPSIAIPALVTHGGADAIVLPQGSQELFALLGSPDKELRIYPGAYHEPHNDLCREEVALHLAAWIAARCP